MEREKFARVDTLLASLSCPVCFETVKDCVVTPCGHSFCRPCAGDAVSRKHVCPVCQGAVVGGESALIRNFLVNELTQSLGKATEETDVAYMQLLFATAASTQPPPLKSPRADSSEGTGLAPTGTTTTATTPKANDDDPMDTVDDDQFSSTFEAKRRSMLSPIEKVLVSRMRKAFLGYQAYYARERAVHEAEVASLSTRLAAARTGSKAGGNFSGTPLSEQEQQRTKKQQDVRALEAAIEESKRRFQTCIDALLRDFDAHAAAAAPPPSLLPSTVTVIVASRGIRFDTQLLPTHFPENVYNKVRAYFAASGDEVTGFGPDTKMFWQALSSAAATPTATTTRTTDHQAQPHITPSTLHPQSHAIDSSTETVFSQSPGGRIGPGWALVIDGAVLLASEEVKPCFAREYGLAGRDPDERVDYFKCGQCKLNWVCASCAAHCHRDCRDVRPFAMNHKPTWACCYCSKKKAKSGECKLAWGGDGCAGPKDA